MMDRTLLRSGLLLCLLLCAGLVACRPAGGAPPGGVGEAPPPTPGATANVQVAPAEQALAVGATTTVALQVRDVRDLYGYQVAIRFDPGVLEVIDADAAEPGIQVTLGNFVQPDFVLQSSADNGAGAILCVVTQLAPSPPVTGRGDLFTITFHGKAQGTSPIRFTDLRLADADGNAIPVTSQEAQIAVGGK